MEIFDYSSNMKEPLKGDMLISDPFLSDPNFLRTVILLCEHSDDGTLGFVLNKPTELKLHDVMDNVEYSDVDLFVGGPVQQDTLHFIHRRGDLIDGGMEVRKGLFWGGDFDQLLLLLREKLIDSEDLKMFVGYSGWSPGQLLEEMQLNSWIISRNVSIQQVFDTDAQKLWKEVLTKMGGKFKAISNFPVDPRLN